MELFAVLGNPIKHSLSPIMHNAAMKHMNINAHYDRFHLSADIKAQDLRSFIMDSNLRGVNITLPLKEIAYTIANRLDDISQEIGAINTIVKDKDNKLLGYNTDIFGFYSCISKADIKSALVLGAGGSAKSVVKALLKRNIDITLANRGQERLESFKNIVNTYTFDNLSKNIKKYNIIINATSASIDNKLPLDKQTLQNLFQECDLAFDLMYSPKIDNSKNGEEDLTAFCKLAKERDIKYIDGKAMLIYQGAKSFLYFHNLGEEYLDKVAKLMASSLGVALA